ncbi:hypothetical protein M1N80_02525 [Peptococcaceae bacterium]|jgi:hypothetical protein|nr:hypothetical protein [Peptococcaceae bacterium]MCL0063277.1 hypothetical protein [Peptococcaceae bacterium]MCL0077490.1 hypothetical protein [Peptococcaceae bacterium]MCL0100672.1 hypothetical protein [Peptococcaceae bacterium]MCL0107463.1 hypothetical protein [Peptococcaceae bacterium]
MDTPTAGEVYFEQQNLTNLSVSKVAANTLKTMPKQAALQPILALMICSSFFPPKNYAKYN